MELKQYFLATVILFASLVSYGFESPDEFPAAPTGVYAPQGFDTNDNVEIFFEGQFTNACQKVGMTFHTVDEDSKSIYITDLGYIFDQEFCATVTASYEKGINAGLLSPGEYKIYFRHSRGNFIESGSVPVRTSESPKPDDHLYIPVSQSMYVPGKGKSAGTLKLLGNYSNSCMKLKEVKVMPHPQKNVVDILPIAEMTEGYCDDQTPRPFVIKVDLAQHLSHGRYLLHTRALNGQSVNQIISIF